MSVTDDSLTFTINGDYTPASIPMERLAEYIAELARMLGESAYVHFDRVEDGSVALKAKVDASARPKVRDRVQAVRTGTAPAETRKHYERLDEMLRRDNSFAALDGGDGVVIPFPGRNRAEPVAYGPFRQQGTLDGEVYRIGGKDASKHVHIHSDDRDLSVLYANQAVALRLRHHLFGGTLRFRGEGTWYRHDNGDWELRSFRIDDFEVLAEESLLETVARLRTAFGDDLGDDPLASILADRRGEGATA